MGADVNFVDQGCLTTFKLPRNATNTTAWKDWQRHLSFLTRAAPLAIGGGSANPVQELARRYLSGNPAPFCTTG